MKKIKYLVAAALVLSLSAPVMAQEANYEDMIKPIEQSIKDNPNMDAKSLDKLLKDYKKTFKKDPKALVALGNILAVNKLYDQANEVGNSVISKFKNYGDAYILLGDVAAMKDDGGNAAQWYQQCMTMDPNNPQGYMSYANVYRKISPEESEKALREFMSDKPISGKIYEIEHPDVPLWAIWAIQQYAKEVGKEQGYKMYGKLVKDIVMYVLADGHPNMRLDDNGLLYANGREKAITWMNSTANGRPVVPRSGYIVEFNALWYNALKFCASLEAEFGDKKFAEKLEKQAEVCKTSFIDTFMNEYGYLLDYVDGSMMDWSVRPNMIFPVAFDYSPLNQEQKKSVLDICTRELLTPKGLRSLSPKSGGYNPMYVGPQTQRDYAYHQGTAWPWLGGFYIEACLKLYKRTRLSFLERHMVGYEEEMDYHALGTISELFDGNPPFHGRGAMAFAMNVAEILRSVKLMEKYSYQK